VLCPIKEEVEFCALRRGEGRESPAELAECADECSECFRQKLNVLDGRKNLVGFQFGSSFLSNDIRECRTETRRRIQRKNFSAVFLRGSVRKYLANEV
jgi:hypothetical protein